MGWCGARGAVRGVAKCKGWYSARGGAVRQVCVKWCSAMSGIVQRVVQCEGWSAGTVRGWCSATSGTVRGVVHCKGWYRVRQAGVCKRGRWCDGEAVRWLGEVGGGAGCDAGDIV